MKSHIVVVLLVRNEQDNLPGLFASADGIVTDWVVVDTGSIDETISTAERLGVQYGVPVHIVEVPWADDFSAPRNAGIEAVERLGLPGDPWVFWLDADDRLERPEAFHALFAHADVEGSEVPDVLALRCVSVSGGVAIEVVVQPRVWRLSTHLRFRHPVHEQPVPPENAPASTGYVGDVAIRHIGYEEGRHNAERTLRIAATMPADDPHRAYVEARALAVMNRWGEVAAAARRAIVAHNGGSYTLPDVSPWVLLSAAQAGCDGDLVPALRTLTAGLREDGLNPDLWFGVLRVGAAGLVASAQAVLGGHLAASATIAKVPKALVALSTSPFAPDEFTPDLLRVIADHLQQALDGTLGANIPKDGPIEAAPIEVVGLEGPTIYAPGALGQSATTEAFVEALGFVRGGPARIEADLAAGRPVLVHGLRPEAVRWGARFPKLVHVLWHSGYAATELLGEEAPLTEALNAQAVGAIRLLWLDRKRSPAPSGAIAFPPLWAPKAIHAALARLGTPPARTDAEIAVGICTPDVAPAKNVLAQIVACIYGGARRVHTAQAGPLVRHLAREHAVEIAEHGVLPNDDVLRLLQRVSLLMHVSHADTWPTLALEAVFAGCPIFVSPSVGFASVLPSGVVAAPASAIEMASAIAGFLFHPAYTRQGIAQGQRAAVDGLHALHVAAARRVLGECGFTIEMRS